MFRPKRRYVASTQSKPNKIQYYNWRFRIVLALIAFVFVALLGRMVYLMVIDRAFLQRQGDMRALRTIEMPAYRGIIADRNGNPLAVSTPVYAVWVDPPSFQASTLQLKRLSELLKQSKQSISQEVSKNHKKDFIYLQRQLPPQVADQIRGLNIPGVFLKEEYRRYYPEGSVVAHVVGLTNIDDQGQEGLELAYNSWLGGVSGLRSVIKDRYGHIVSDIHLLREPKPGKNLVLSIDKRIQYVAYRALGEQLETFDAASGSVVVLDTKTNEILAMVNLPSYNPNDRPKLHDGRFRNRAVTDTFEPGSTMKTFAVSQALESGKYQPDTIIDTTPGWYMIGSHRVNDEHKKGAISVTQVLQYSSNVGVSKMILSLSSPTILPNYLRKIGFGSKTASNFPGESNGNFPIRESWPTFELATLSFGYGISVTALQLAQAYSILANNGVELPVSFLKLSQVPQGKQVMSPKIAKELVVMLESVVEAGGTAPQVQVPGYLVAGKTGTSRMVGPHGYEAHHHNAVFAGLAPASHPRIVIVVYINDPKKISYYGGYAAGPVFAKVMGATLRMLNIPPDNLTPDNTVKPQAAIKSEE